MDALGHEDRRALLLALREENPQSATGTEESASTPADDEGSSVATTAVLRRHNHLPKLEEYGYIDRDEAADEIVKGPNWDQIEPFLDYLADDSTEPSVETD